MNIKTPLNKRCLPHLLLLSFWLITPLTMAQFGGPAPVKIALAQTQAIAPVTLVPGTVVSRNDARLAAEVEGRLISVAEVGTVVSAGDVLAEIDSQPLRLLNQELQAEIVRAQARLNFLESELKRFARLAESNLAALSQLEQTRSERDVAQGDLDVARARLAQNADQLKRARLVAPFDGLVAERLMSPGEHATVGGIVVRLVDTAHLEVIARAPLDYLDFVQPGDSLSLRSGAGTVMATVRTTVAVGDERTHQFELRLDIAGNSLPLGQTVRVAVPVSSASSVLTVPRDALVLRPEGQSIFVVDDNNEARQVMVTTGIGSDDRIEVKGDVSDGDRVVIRGNERLQPGQSVSVMDS